MTSSKLARAHVLLAQGRPADAEREARRMLARNPQHPEAMIILAICLQEQKKLDVALDVAHQAIGLAPEKPPAHFAMARVLYSLERWKDAHRAIAEAIRLAPRDADYYSLQGAIFLAENNWQEALASAVRGLQCDPEHVDCANLRSMALTKMGRRAEAGLTIDETLRREPENAMTHANKGWTLLHENRPHEAMLSFREALRLEPDNEWARQGILEALRARHFIYRQMLKYYLFMSQLSGRARWGVILGFYILYQFLNGYGRSTPTMQPFIVPVLILYAIFVYLTWISRPLFNLALFINSFGRLALNEGEKRQARVVGLTLLTAIMLLIAGGRFGNAEVFILGIVSLTFLIPLSNVLEVTARRWLRERITATLILAALGIAGAFADPSLLSLYFIGILGFSIFANAAR